MHKKIYSVQLLRAIAVSLVILVHAINFGLVGIASKSFIASFYHLKSWGGIGVDLFFAISGFIMTIIIPSYYNKPQGWKSFLIKRAVRIIPLYYLVTAFELFLKVFLYHQSFDIRVLIKSMIFFPLFERRQFIIPLVNIGWTLSYEIYFYLIVCFILVFKSNPYLKLLLVLSFLSVLGIYLNAALPILKFLSSPMLLEFGLGVSGGLVYKLFILSNKSSGQKKLTSIFLIIVGLIAMCTTIFIAPVYDILSQKNIENNNLIAFYRVIVWGIPSVLFMLGVVLFESTFNLKTARILTLSGDASYSCYLIHAYFYLMLATVFSYFSLNADLYLILVIPVCTGLSIIFYKYIEKPITVAINNRLVNNKEP